LGVERERQPACAGGPRKHAMNLSDCRRQNRLRRQRKLMHG
jgi:hypothetical protein